jgi:hypothetical protein
MAKYTKVTVDLTGPFFQKDPGLTVRGNIRKMVQGIAEEGEKAARGAIDALPLPNSVGWTSAHTVGRAESLSGKSWWLHAVISANTDGMNAKDAIRTKAAASSVEGRYHPYRRTASAIRRSRAVLSANLTAGIE